MQIIYRVDNMINKIYFFDFFVLFHFFILIYFYLYLDFFLFFF